MEAVGILRPCSLPSASMGPAAASVPGLVTLYGLLR